MLTTVELMPEAPPADRVGKVLPRWLREVPLYQRAAKLLPLNGKPLALADLHRLPLITKHDIRRDFPRNFLRAGVELDTLLDQNLVELEQTSGTSEERVPLLLGRGWWAEQEERALRLNPLAARVLDDFPAARRVTITSPVCSGDICYSGVPTRADRIVGNALFVSLSRYPFLWSDAELARMAGEAADWQPQFLDVDPVYGVLFALYCERQRIRLPSLRFILSSYEFVSAAHRRILQRVFGVPVLNLYGSTETGHLLMETGPDEMRPSQETALLEMVATDEQGIGDLVVTTLTNDFMPLIRYRIGDLVEQLGPPRAPRYVVHGRAADAFFTPAGRRVTTWQIDQCLADLPGMVHYQLCEQPDGGWLLRFVPDPAAPNAALPAELQRRLVERLEIRGQLVVQATDLLVPERSGKFRLGYPARKPAPAS